MNDQLPAMRPRTPRSRRRVSIDASLLPAEVSATSVAQQRLPASDARTLVGTARTGRGGGNARRRGSSLDLETVMALAIGLEFDLPEPVREYRFAPPRRWRFDFAFPDAKVALEIEGGIWTAGRHSRGAGMRDDMEKYNAAACAGWRVLRVHHDLVHNGQALQLVREALGVGK